MHHRLLPPKLVLLLLVVAVPIGVLAPVLGPLARPIRLLGIVPVVAGLGLTLSGSTLFSRVGTNIRTFNDPGVLVTAGPFAHTRNPMYLGFVVFLAGVALVVGTLTAWIAPACFALAADRWYIPFEERRMLATFGADYEDYRRRVPRWFGPVGRARQLTP